MLKPPCCRSPQMPPPPPCMLDDIGDRGIGVLNVFRGGPTNYGVRTFTGVARWPLPLASGALGPATCATVCAVLVS